MAKPVKRYVCQSCGATSPKWIGKCDQCGEWNTYTEEWTAKGAKSISASPQATPAVTLQDVESLPRQRLTLPDDELNRSLGGGLVRGSTVLLAGQPGIGKSTLLLQMACHSALKVLFVSGEESPDQIKLRAGRIGHHNTSIFILNTTDVTSIIDQITLIEPDVVIVDSIQTLQVSSLESAPGTVSQIRESALGLIQVAKRNNVPVFLIGHITKEGAIAGPKLLEHMVDVVLQFEGERQYNYRLVRTMKNRFGNTDDLGIYEMTAKGLQPVANPSAMWISQTTEAQSGSTIAATLEGMRPLLIETQALVSTAVFGTPQRNATGFDLRRLNMLLAVLEKRAGIPYGTLDVFLNLAGGLRITDPSIDLAIIVALVSSRQDIAVSNKACFAGEVGLSGEIRAVRFAAQRIQEAARLGMSQFYLSPNNKKSLDGQEYGIELIFVASVGELMSALFG